MQYRNNPFVHRPTEPPLRSPLPEGQMSGVAGDTVDAGTRTIAVMGIGAAGYMLWESRKKEPSWWKTGLVVLLGPVAWFGAFASSVKK